MQYDRSLIILDQPVQCDEVTGDTSGVGATSQQHPAPGGRQLLLGVLEVVQKDGVGAVDPRVDRVHGDILAQAGLQGTT